MPEELYEPQLTPEEQAEQDIMAASDCELVICQDESLVSHPVKWMVRRSKSLTKQVVKVNVIRRIVERGGRVAIGHEVTGLDSVRVEEYSKGLPEITTVQRGQRERGR